MDSVTGEFFTVERSQLKNLCLIISLFNSGQKNQNFLVVKLSAYIQQYFPQGHAVEPPKVK